MKRDYQPRVRHSAFTGQALRLVHDDWLLMVWCPNNKQALYCLAEPEFSEDKKKIQGYRVSALERRGDAVNLMHGLPKSFRSTDAALDWLEAHIEDYDGDLRLSARA